LLKLSRTGAECPCKSCPSRDRRPAQFPACGGGVRSVPTARGWSSGLVPVAWVVAPGPHVSRDGTSGLATVAGGGRPARTPPVAGRPDWPP
jgi:hypothetical protein